MEFYVRVRHDINGGCVNQDSSRLPSENHDSLIQRVKAGEVELFAELVQPYQRGLQLTCYSILQNHADAEEAAQETMLKALVHLDQLRIGQCFRGWLFQIAINEARRRLRKDHRHDCGSADSGETGREESEFVARDFADWRDVPSLELERKELWVAVNRALRSMDPIYREVFVLRDMQHMRVSHTAMVLGITEACVSTRLHRARLLMRERLSPLFHGPAKKWASLQKAMGTATQNMRKVMSRNKIVHELSS